MSNAHDQVIAVERAFWNADAEAYDQNMMDGALSVMEPMGFITKESAVEMTKDAEGWTDLEISDMHVVDLTEDCIAIAYHGRAKFAKSGKPIRSSVSSVYVREGGEWKLGITVHQPWPEPDTLAKEVS